ncbi:ADP-ribosylglycohydrolase [Halapricum desulfuricans]|uniref:ADP-ribosylglycohydrolase n=1 Tax=Halapricum desulfuricans TaxID=2841257 RepID=A0A897MQS3_9EURY|nr:ADP-ribosylglycohydrolase [Halapricum desulfuricans]
MSPGRGSLRGGGGLSDRWLETVEYRDELEWLARALATTDIDPPA